MRISYPVLLTLLVLAVGFCTCCIGQSQNLEGEKQIQQMKCDLDPYIQTSCTGIVTEDCRRMRLIDRPHGSQASEPSDISPAALALRLYDEGEFKRASSVLQGRIQQLRIQKALSDAEKLDYLDARLLQAQTELVLGNYGVSIANLEALLTDTERLSARHRTIAECLLSQAIFAAGDQQRGYELTYTVWQRLRPHADTAEQVAEVDSLAIAATMQIAMQAATIGDIKFAAEALEKLERVFPDEQQGWKSTIFRGRVALLRSIVLFQCYAPERAYQEISKAIEQREKLGLKHDRELISMYSWAARAKLRTPGKHNIELADDLIETASRKLRESSYDGKIEVASLLYLKAQVEAATGKTDASREHFSQAIELLSKEASSHPDLAHSRLGLLSLEDQPSVQHTFSVMKEAAQALENHSYVDSGRTCLSLAKYLALAEHPDAAMSLCDHIQATAENFAGAGHPMIAASYCLTFDLKSREGEAVSASQKLSAYATRLDESTPLTSYYDPDYTRLMEESVRRRLQESDGVARQANRSESGYAAPLIRQE